MSFSVSKILTLALVVGLLSACASTRVFPSEDGTATLISNSASESAAYDAALDDAQKYCIDRGRRMVMVSQSSTYNGADKDTKVAIETVGWVTGNPTNVDRPDDYRVELCFKCI